MTESGSESCPEELVTGMGTGSDAGAPGDQLPAPPLTEDDKAVLFGLETTDGADVVRPVEDSPESEWAAEDDGPLPVTPPVGDDDDPDTPRFSAGANR